MPSTFFKIFLAFTSLSPALLLLYIVGIVRKFKDLSIYTKASSIQEVASGIRNLLEIHYLLILFIFFLLGSNNAMKFAEKRFAIGRILVKSIKSADNNFVSVISSLIPFVIKLFSPDFPEWITLIVFVIVGLILASTARSAYHFNIVLRLFWGYRHYEIQTKDEVTYLMLSKAPLINKKEISKYVQLADHMLVNVS